MVPSIYAYRPKTFTSIHKIKRHDTIIVWNGKTMKAKHSHIRIRTPSFQAPWTTKQPNNQTTKQQHHVHKEHQLHNFCVSVFRFLFSYYCWCCFTLSFMSVAVYDLCSCSAMQSDTSYSFDTKWFWFLCIIIIIIW